MKTGISMQTRSESMRKSERKTNEQSSLLGRSAPQVSGNLWRRSLKKLWISAKIPTSKSCHCKCVAFKMRRRQRRKISENRNKRKGRKRRKEERRGHEEEEPRRAGKVPDETG